MIREIQFDFGEARHVRLEIRNIRHENFSIDNAEYELTDVFQLFPEDSGSAEIIDHVIDVLISPKHAGEYNLKFKYEIGDEKLIDVIRVRVV